MVIFHASPTFEYTLHTRPFQRFSLPSGSRHTVSMSTTAKAPSPSSDTSIFRISRSLRTSSCVSNSSCQPLPHLPGSYLPHSRTQSIGSCDLVVLGQGQTMSGWNTVSKRSTSRVSQALVSRSTISSISDLTPPIGPSLHTVAQPAEAGALVRRQALLAQLLQGVLALSQVAEAHCAQYVGGFGELDLGVLHDLPAVAPRVEEVETPAGQDLHVHLVKRPPHRPPVVDHHTDVAMIVWVPRPPLREGDELVPRVYERHSAPAPAQLHFEESPEELQGLLNVANLEGDVVEPHQCRAGRHAPILSPGSEPVAAARPHRGRTNSAIASRPSMSSISSHCSITRSTPASSSRASCSATSGPVPTTVPQARSSSADRPASLRSTSAAARPKMARVISVRRTASGGRPASRSSSSRRAFSSVNRSGGTRTAFHSSA